ncbi:MAG: hypothetical protein GF315_00140 [candidate division Zixibacteria bacterium]|nr:hypothetical protein [candidate division Zixibacteria bacterium]
MEADKTKIKKLISKIARKHGVKKAGLFGSIVRSEMTAESDIDLLIEFESDKSLLDLVRLKMELEKSIGRKVDVLTYDSLHHLLRKKILAEQEIIF